MSFLKLENMEKTYENGFQALKNINFTMEAEDFLVLLGPSGCGKSTMLRIIAGLETATGGNIFLQGEKITHKEPSQRNMSMVFQDYALYPHMTVFDNIAFGLQVRKVAKKTIKKEVKALAQMMDIESLLARKPMTLSGGQRQRVAIARSLIRDPKLFLMDEPLSNLDAQLKYHMRREIAKIHQNTARTFIYVTHDQMEAMALATKIIILDQGEIQQIDRPENIYKTPKNIFVAGFIGNFPMNMLSVESDVDLLKRITAHHFVEKERKIILGIRPEDIQVGEERTKENSLSLSGRIQLQESLGQKSLVDISLDTPGFLGMTIQALVSEKVRNNDRVEVEIPLEVIHIFDHEIGNRLGKTN